MIGSGLFGMVDQVPGECHVATRFFCIGIPVVPLDSWAVVDRKELVTPGFLVQAVTGLPTAPEGAVNGIRIPFNLRSVLLTYARIALWMLHGPAAALTVILGLFGLLLLFDAAPIGPFQPWEQQAIAGLVGTSIVTGFLLWLSYRLTRATPERAAELRAMLGLGESPPSDATGWGNLKKQG
jgi:hypothetical protein